MPSLLLKHWVFSQPREQAKLQQQRASTCCAGDSRLLLWDPLQQQSPAGARTHTAILSDTCISQSYGARIRLQSRHTCLRFTHDSGIP